MHVGVVNECPGAVESAKIRRDGLRAEELGVHEVSMARADVKRPRNKMFGRENVVQLRKRVDGFGLRLIERERQRADRSFCDVVFGSLGQEELVRDERSAEADPGRRIAQTTQLPTPNPAIGERVVEFEVPLLPAAPGFDGDNTRSKSAILRQERSLVHVDRLNALYGERAAESARCRIGNVSIIHNQGTPVFSISADLNLAIGSSRDARHQGQRIGDGRWPSRQGLDILRMHRRRCGDLLQRWVLSRD